jgi:hypothetical protein
MQSVYIILLNYNGWRDTIECLESLLRMDYPNYRLVMVDNGSRDGSPEYLQAWATGHLNVWVNPVYPLRYLSHPPVEKPLPFSVYHQNDLFKETHFSPAENAGNAQTPSNRRPLIFIRAEENLGFTGGNNLGLQFALAHSADYVLLLNNDTVATPSFLSALMECAKTLPEAAIIGGNIFYYDTPNRVWAAGGGKLYKFTGLSKHYNPGDRHLETQSPYRKLDYITGCLMLIKREILEITGLFDDHYFLYYEESDLCYRAREKGFQCVYTAEAHIYHKVSSTVQPVGVTGTYYMTRNRHYFIQKHFRGVHKISALLFESGFNFLRQIYHLLRGRPDKAKTISRAMDDAKRGKMGRGAP